jgi:putative alpha-1,2-mannosidase
VLNSPGNSDENRYVQSLQFNRQSWDKNWVSHFDLMKGATLNFTMGARPNKSRGISEKAYPFSMSSEAELKR